MERVAKLADRKRASFAGNRIRKRNERRVGLVCAYQKVHRFRLAFEPSTSIVRTQGCWCGKNGFNNLPRSNNEQKEYRA